MIFGNADHEPRERRQPEDPFARSVLAELSLPGERLLCSGELGWRTMLARTYVDPPCAEQFTTAQSGDLLVVLITGGAYTIESRKGRCWGRANYRPGSVGVTAPGNVSVLRWRTTSGQRLESLHMHLGADLLKQTSDALGEKGSWQRRLPDSLLLDDPLVTAAGQAVGRALQGRAPTLYADSIAQLIATHLLYGSEPEIAAEIRPAALGESTLRLVTAYMHEHLHEDVSLDDLAAVANISKYHLLRAFAKATGFTPHRYLVRLRMSRAADLLRDTAQPVLHISMACGYRSHGQFTAAFRRRFGASPREFRRQFQE
ncbi:helix-turn-helix domain-containing protein [Nonomuraea sp. M3C6]|uniref:Helix-turn-helix domain-containing protein n=1 Tax=Nonomuraea marmarensis TaxID=3351344 RepID=A0ABW7ATJ1_9ACTN